MPQSDDHLSAGSRQARGDVTADDLIAQLVGEMVGQAGGTYREADADLVHIEQQLAAMREAAARPAPEVVEVEPPEPEPAPVFVAPPAPPVPPAPRPAAVAPAPVAAGAALPGAAVISLAERQAQIQREAPASAGTPLRRRMTIEERLAALKALSDDIEEAESRSAASALPAPEPAVPPAGAQLAEAVAMPHFERRSSSDMLQVDRPEPRRASASAASSIDDVLVHAAEAGGSRLSYIDAELAARRGRRGGVVLPFVLGSMVIVLSALLVLSWLSPTGARGLLDGSSFSHGLAVLSGTDQIAVASIAPAALCDTPATAIPPIASMAPVAGPVAPVEAATQPAATRPLTANPRSVRTYRVGADGQIVEAEPTLAAQLPAVPVPLPVD